MKETNTENGLIAAAESAQEKEGEKMMESKMCSDINEWEEHVEDHEIELKIKRIHTQGSTDEINFLSREEERINKLPLNEKRKEMQKIIKRLETEGRSIRLLKESRDDLKESKEYIQLSDSLLRESEELEAVSEKCEVERKKRKELLNRHVEKIKKVEENLSLFGQARDFRKYQKSAYSIAITS